MSNEFDLAVYIGRFQPLHYGHVGAIQKAFDVAKNVLVLVGSSNIAPNVRNPFTFAQRQEMIFKAHVRRENQTLAVEPITDNLYSNFGWIEQVQGKVKQAAEHFGAKKIALVGYEKDESSFYLKLFPQWTFVPNDFARVLSATEIRDHYLNGSLDFTVDDAVPKSTYDFLKEFRHTPEYDLLVKEMEFLKSYKKQFENLPYAPVFVTVDAVVVNRGHVLVVKRKSYPGKGLWALPGGFLQPNEAIVDGIVRELKEETKIKFHYDLLKSQIQHVKAFDAPGRSLRGRTITHAGLIVLHENPLPPVKGSDDAEHAKWMPISEIREHPEVFFEDHFSIITHMVGMVA